VSVSMPASWKSFKLSFSKPSFNSTFTLANSF
jgi:hypothetical protein